MVGDFTYSKRVITGQHRLDASCNFTSKQLLRHGLSFPFRKRTGDRDGHQTREGCCELHHRHPQLLLPSTALRTTADKAVFVDGVGFR